LPLFGCVVPVGVVGEGDVEVEGFHLIPVFDYYV
jgi:hypothetical protein